MTTAPSRGALLRGKIQLCVTVTGVAVCGCQAASSKICSRMHSQVAASPPIAAASAVSHAEQQKRAREGAYRCLTRQGVSPVGVQAGQNVHGETRKGKCNGLT